MIAAIVLRHGYSSLDSILNGANAMIRCFICSFLDRPRLHNWRFLSIWDYKSIRFIDDISIFLSLQVDRKPNHIHSGRTEESKGFFDSAQIIHDHPPR